MADGVAQERWNHTAQILATLCELQRNPKRRSRPFTADEFHPYLRRAGAAFRSPVSCCERRPNAGSPSRRTNEEPPMAFTVSMKIVDAFFDRPAVLNRMDRATARSLAKAGAFVRRRAISRLRRRKRYSRPGESPSIHSTDRVANLRNILFGFDGRYTVVVGPVGLNQKQYVAGRITAGTVPATLEFGGQVGIREKLVGRKWMPVGRRRPRTGPTDARADGELCAASVHGTGAGSRAGQVSELWARSVSA
jgi:hypothetical protein